MSDFFVRTGVLGHVGRFAATGFASYERGARVICRTARGLELGQVLGDADLRPRTRHDGLLLRGVTSADDLLIVRLEQHRHEAFASCSRLLQERGLKPRLIDVEQLFDGKTIFFYFLGELTGELEALIDELATAYEQEAQIGRFADLLTSGCGPDCGTELGAGCGDACGGCQVAAACRTHGH